MANLNVSVAVTGEDQLSGPLQAMTARVAELVAQADAATAALEGMSTVGSKEAAALEMLQAATLQAAQATAEETAALQARTNAAAEESAVIGEEIAAVDARVGALYAAIEADGALAAAAGEATGALVLETASLAALAPAAAAVREEFVSGAAAMAAAFIGFEAAREVIGKTVETAREMAQAQLQLNAMFGEGAEKYAKFAEETAAGTNFTTVQFERASVVLSELQRDYGLTDEQMQQLLHTTADLAASSGTDLVKAAEDVRGSMAGMTRAGAELGINLRGPVVQALQGVDEQTKKNITSSDANTAALARLAALNAEAAQRMGAAARAAREEGDTFAQLDKATAHLYETLAGGSTIGAVTGDLGKAVTAADHLIQVFDVLGSGSVTLGHAVQGLGGFIAEAGGALADVNRKGAAVRTGFEEIGQAVSLFGQGLSFAQAQLGLTSATVVDAAQQHSILVAKEREAAEASKEHAAITDEEKKSLDALGQSLAEVAQAEGDLASRHPTLDIGQATSVNWSITADSIKQARDRLVEYGLALAATASHADDFRHAQLDMTQATEVDNRITLERIKQQADDQEKAARDAQAAQKRAADEAERIAREHWDRMNVLEDRARSDQQRLEDRRFAQQIQAQEDAYRQQEDAARSHADDQIAAIERQRDASLKALQDTATSSQQAIFGGGDIVDQYGRVTFEMLGAVGAASSDHLDAERQRIKDLADAQIAALRDQETAQERSYQQRDQASRRYWDAEKQRIGDARHAYDEYLADTRYAAEHPGEGGVGSFAAAFGGTAATATPGARGVFAGTAAAAAGGAVVINQTVNVNGVGEDTVAVVVRASRDGLTQALLAAGLTS